MKSLGKKNSKAPTKNRCGRDNTKLPTKLPDANESSDKEITSKENVKLKTKNQSKNDLRDQIKLEDEPCSSQEILSANPDVPESVIDKIKKILIQYNFLNMEEGTDVKGLVEILQKVILASLNGDPANTCDDLTERIAKVLFESKTRSDQPTDSSSTSLEKEPATGSKAEPAPSDTNSQNDGDDSENDGANGNHTKRKRGLEKEDTPMTEDSAAFSTKRKRKAALKAKEKLDSIDSVIIINNDDDDWTMEENNSILAAILKRGKNKPATKNAAYEKEKRRNCDGIASDDAIAEPKNDSPVKGVQGQSTKQTPDKERPSSVMSILVSDDDDDVIIKANEPEKGREVGKERPQNANRDDDIQSDEQIPLHASLLTNQNFIKIVAHTYLAQNVMLDEDAALLAAKYGAQSALKEIQAGKQIYSGPIYDIAVNVVGIKILKQLQSSLKTTDSVKMDQKESIERKHSEPSTSRTNLKSIVESKTDQAKKCKTDKKATSVSAKRTQQRQNSSDSDDLVLVESTRADQPRRRKCYADNRLRGKVSSEDSKSTSKGSKDRKKSRNTTTVISNEKSPKAEALPQKVFPVQRITRGERQSQTSNSSISATMVANDDDDVRVVDNPATPPAPESNLRRRNSQPMIINSVRATDQLLPERPTKICKENSTVKSNQMTNTTAKPSTTAVDAEATLIIPDIDLDEEITVASAKKKTNMQSSQARICPTLKSPFATVSTVEAPLIISDIDLDDDPIEHMGHSESITIKSSAGKSGRKKKGLTMRESLIIPDIDLDDDIIEHTEKTEEMTKENLTVKSSKTKKGATMRDSLIIPDIDVDDDIIEHTEQTKTTRVDKLSQKKKSPTVRESLIIPDIDLDDDIIGHTEKIEGTTKKCATAKFGQTKKGPTTSESLIIPDIDLDEVSTQRQERSKATTEPEATKGSGSETICLDSDDEEAIVIKKSADPPIPDVVLSNKTMSRSTASAAKTRINPASCIDVDDDTDNTNATSKADTKFVKNIKTVPGDGNKPASKDLPQTSLADDPLLVLQDVIHISADNFDVIDISQTKETPTYKQRNSRSNTDDPQRDSIFTKHSQSSRSSEQASTKSAHALLLKFQQVKDYIMSKPTSSSSSNSVDLINTNTDTDHKKIFTGKLVGGSNSRNSNGEGRLVEQMDAKKSGSIAVVGSVKDIMIRGKVDKNLLKPSTVESTSKTIKNKESIKSEASQFAGGKKRPMTSNKPGPAKKIKSETCRQLTLKDFNIDDIDDIIELE